MEITTLIIRCLVLTVVFFVCVHIYSLYQIGSICACPLFKNLIFSHICLIFCSILQMYYDLCLLLGHSVLSVPSPSTLPPSYSSIVSALLTSTAISLQLNCLDRSMVISQRSRVMVLKYSSDFVVSFIHISSLCCDQSELFILKILCQSGSCQPL